MLASVTEKFTKECKEKYGLRCCGQGVAAFGGPIQSIGYSFQTNELWTKEELRKLLVTCANELVKTVNETPGMNAYLAHPPFTLNDMSIGIFLRNTNWGRVYSPNISIADIDQCGLSYWYDTPVDYPRAEIIKESYEEALEAIRNSE